MFCYYLKHFIFHLEIHSNTNLEGMFNGIMYRATPVGPQNSMDKAVTCLMDNANFKTQDKLIERWAKTHSTELWSESPTTNFVTDLCKSMLVTAWKKGNDWIPHCAGQYQWLVAHKKEKEHGEKEDHLWELDDQDGKGEDGKEENQDNPDQTTVAAKKFGIIPKFQRVYEVHVDSQDRCFKCKCGNQERMGFPCCHIASVVQGTSSLSNMHRKGFPVSAVRVFWRLEYYLYGLSPNAAYKTIQDALSKLAENDTNKGLKCPTLSPQDHYNVPEGVVMVFTAPAYARVLNYTSSQVMTAMLSVKDKNNPTILPYGDHPGFSQTSHFGGDL